MILRAICLMAFCATAALAGGFGGQQIESAGFAGTDLPKGRSAITARVQILLDRAGISPGVIDGYSGGMSDSALRAFQSREGLPVTGRLDSLTWGRLHAQADQPMTRSYRITDDDARGLVPAIPSDYAEKAQMDSQGYTSIPEKLAERFHMDEGFLRFLNPNVQFVPGDVITVTDPGIARGQKVTRIRVNKTTRRVTALDVDGRVVADYPATIGSQQTPSPEGRHVVSAIALDPIYTYNPSRNFQQGDNDKPLRIPPGPNGPVGDVWISLSKPSYGIHGTATPSQLFVNQSSGCVRLTNWDAQELARLVLPGQTVVEFTK